MNSAATKVPALAHAPYAAALVALSLAAPARALPPAIIPIQGQLTELDGTPLDGEHDIRLGLFRVAIGGTPVHTETHADVPVENGAFVVYLGNASSGVPLDLALMRDNEELWLEVTIDGTETISPRFRLGTAPYAAAAQYCGDAARLGDRPAADYLTVDHDVSFEELVDVPASIADGDDDSLANLSCDAGAVPVRTGSGWTCRPLAAADIASGVLNTARFSAYADLVDEDRIDTNNGQSLLTRNAADLRYLNVAELPALTVTGHAVVGPEDGSNTVMATGKAFCALARGGGNCQITANGSGSFTLTATGTSSSSTPCAMLCF